MKKAVGTVFMICAFVFLALHSFIRLSGENGKSYDLFGLAINTPPDWVSMIPAVGPILEWIFSMFSLHGIVGVIIFAALAGMGSLFLGLKK